MFTKAKRNFHKSFYLRLLIHALLSLHNRVDVAR